MSKQPRRSFLTRARRFLALFLRSKMAVVGIILLVLFSLTALAAPLITPYNPENDIVAGSFASPQWVTIFPDSKVSLNTEFFDDPHFMSERSAPQWALASPGAGVSLSYEPGISAPDSPGGSLGVSYSRTSLPGSNVRVTLQKTLSYPYSAPPGAFSGTVLVRVVGTTVDEPILVDMFAGRIDGEKFILARFNLTSNPGQTSWNTPPVPINSNLNDFKEKVLELGGSPLSPSIVVFPNAGIYRLGFDIVFTDNGLASTKSAAVYLDNISLDLRGNAFGWLGTDGGGRDLFTQLVYGARVSLAVGLIAALLGIVIGLIVGLFSGYVGRWVDEALMRFNDMMLTIPTFPLLIVLILLLGPKLINFVIILGLLGWNGFARIVRSQVLTLKERPFIEASRAAGGGTAHIIRRHILPNVVSLTYVNLALAVPNAILAEAALSWLGLGDPTVISWGRILNNAQSQGGIFDFWFTVPPGLAIAAVSLSFVLIGYALDDIFNPKLRKRL